MIGKICITIFPYYDIHQNKKLFKARPVLIIGGPRNRDYTVLPISTVSRSENIDAEYDVRIDPQNYPELKLDRISYVRVHKQTTVHEGDIRSEVSDMREACEQLYLDIMSKLEEFNKMIIDKAL